MSATVDFRIRPATRADLPRLIELLQQDTAGPRKRVDDAGPPLPSEYDDAFREIDSDGNSLLLAGELDGNVVATLQLSFLRHLTHRGGRVALVEAVRVDPTLRRRGLGAALMAWVVAEARRRGCFRVQLTSHQQRRDAHRFYERLGFVASHVGMKLDLEADG
jgi:GNAT superfamily N-acetyltransferase